MPIELKHTKHAELQRQAYNALEKHGPLPYTEFKNQVGISQETMQSVLRGLADNGLLTSSLDEDGVRLYSVDS